MSKKIIFLPTTVRRSERKRRIYCSVTDSSLTLRMTALIAVTLVITGCQMTYLVKSGYHQAQLIRNRVPIEKILQDPNLDQENKRKIYLIQETRKFAEIELGLTPTENYTTYVKINGPYVSYIVQAAPQYALEHFLWSFPLVGKLPYIGYFEKSEADQEAKVLQERGYDTMVRGVRAYSTLGWLNDPILSSMMTERDWDLVNLIIHESTHATLYIKSSADFNEQLATFVGNRGTELFYQFKEGKNSTTLKTIRDMNSDEQIFSQFITKELESLRQSYKNETPSIDWKNKKLNEIQSRFIREIESKMKTANYTGFKNQKLNNAVLLGYKVYSDDLTSFETAFQKQGSDMKKFIQYCKTLKGESDPKLALRKISSL